MYDHLFPYICMCTCKVPQIHKYLSIYAFLPTGVNQNLLEMITKIDAEDSVCPVCLDVYPEVETQCRHVFHRQCLQDWIASSKTSCPMCRLPVSLDCLVAQDPLHHAILGADQLAASALYNLEERSIQQIQSNKLIKIAECVLAEINENRIKSTPPKFVIASSLRPVS